uniref:Uncharacterized protein n=1 Tax=Meloidogyne enterolobii TaxID=390850 RepID=A0A6V7VXY5_MELEN|nr:unnamed protein product [Meloidogyne enterolobii]
MKAPVDKFLQWTFLPGLRLCPPWNPHRALLLICDNRGNFVLFDYLLSRKVPIMGKHQRSIRTCAWNKQGTLFALGSDDTQITINNAEGETTSTFSCNGEIIEIKFAHFRNIGSERSEDYISAIIAHKNLMIVRLSEPEHPTNLQFQERYGNLVSTVWFGNGNLLVGFDAGFIVCLSAERSSDSISQELFSMQEYKNGLSHLCVNETMFRLFSIGDNLMKSRDLGNLGEIIDIVDVDSDGSGLLRVCCSEDGSMTAVTSRSGALCVYLTRLPMVASASPSFIAVLASLSEISIYQDGNISPAQSLNIKVEPSIIAVGSKHIAIVLNNKAWFYEIRRNTNIFLYEHDYITTIVKMKLSRDFVMARLDKRVHLHKILRGATSTTPSNVNTSSSTTSTANSAPDDSILDSDLAEKFFIYSTKRHFIYYYSLAYGRFVSDFRHSAAICSLFCEPDGIRCLFLDELHDIYIYSPSDGRLCKILLQGPFEGGHQHCLWETFTVDKDTFLVHGKHHIYVFMLAKDVHQGIFFIRILTKKF